MMISNGRPVVEIYGKHEANNKDVQGGILSMNFLRANGSYIGYYQIQTESAAKNIHVRTGCHCNPGACRKYLKEPESVLKTLSLEKDSCSDEIDMVNGKPVGGIRVSLGYLTNFNDIMRYVDFVKTYIDAWSVCFILDMGSNPAFLLVKEGYVVLVQRLFDAFRWLYTESGEIEVEGSLDVSSLRAMDCFSVENEGLFENQSILFNLPWMLLPEKWTAELIAHYNLAAVAVESSAKGYWVKVQSESNDSIDLQTLWSEFFKACKLSWQSQYGTEFSEVVVIFPDYYSSEAREVVLSSLQSLHSCSYSLYSFVYSSVEYCIYIECTEFLFYACLVNTNTSEIRERVLLPIQNPDPLHLLTNKVIESLYSSQSSIPENELRALYRTIRLQLRHHLHRSYEFFRLLPDLDSDREISCFRIAFHSSFLSFKSYQVTYKQIEESLKESLSFSDNLKQLCGIVAQWCELVQNNVSVLLDGLYSSLPVVRRCFQGVNLSLKSFMSRITDQVNQLQPSLCNDFAFLDHSLSVAIQDGFAMVVLKQGIPLPTQTTSTLFFSLSQNRNAVLSLLRGNSYKVEDLVPVTFIPLEYTSAQLEFGGVEIRITLLIDKQCNLIVSIVDSFDHHKTIRIPSDEFINSSEENVPISSEPFVRPTCSRFTSYYQGEMENGMAQGLGRLFDNRNQLKYEGYWEKGSFSGKGTYYFQNGDVYEGSFSENCLHGMGILYDRQGLVVKKGYFDRVKIEETESGCMIPFEPLEEYIAPLAVESPSNGKTSRYEGERIGGIPCGQGVLYDENDRKVYEGGFKDGLFEGAGKTFFPSGAVQSSGMFSRGKLEGNGVLYSESQNVIMEGTFRHGLPHGLCSCYRDVPNKQLTFEGFYLNGKQEGFGTQFDSDGTVAYRGYFYHGNVWDHSLFLSFSPQNSTITATTLKNHSGRCFFGRKIVIAAMNGLAVTDLLKSAKSQTKCVIEFFRLQSRTIRILLSFSVDDVAASLSQEYVDLFFQLLLKCPNLETLCLNDSSIRFLSIPESFPHLATISFDCFLIFLTFHSPDLPSLLSITLQANSLPKLTDFTLSSLPSLQTLSIQSNCASQLNPHSITQDPERWRRESAFLNKRFVLSGSCEDCRRLTKQICLS